MSGEKATVQCPKWCVEHHDDGIVRHVGATHRIDHVRVTVSRVQFTSKEPEDYVVIGSAWLPIHEAASMAHVFVILGHEELSDQISAMVDMLSEEASCCTRSAS